jgi:CheY-like chemotaxis protein
MGISHDNLAHHGQRLNGNGKAAAGDGDAINILLVEDSYGDALLMLDAFNHADIPYVIDRIDNGDDVLPYLERAAQDKMPDIIFLDLELPGTDGYEILERLARSPAAMRSSPIVIVTIQSNLSFLQGTYELPIYGHLIKPVNVESVKTILTTIFGVASARKKPV